MKKYTQKDIEIIFEEQGCKLLGKYINTDIPMEYICSCGDKSKITLSNFKHGQRCKKCGRKKMVEKRKLSYNFVKQYFLDRDCELLESEYLNSRTKMKYKCVCGNNSEITFSSFKTDHRCAECARKKMSKATSGAKNHFWNPDRKQVEKNKSYSTRCRRLLRSCLERIGKQKEDHTHILLGYSPKQLQHHIENHSNYEKVKDGKWHIDHIFPVKAFVEYNIFDVKIINSLDNLQPLSEFDNISKSDKYKKDDFINYCKNHNINYKVQVKKEKE